MRLVWELGYRARELGSRSVRGLECRRRVLARALESR